MNGKTISVKNAPRPATSSGEKGVNRSNNNSGKIEMTKPMAVIRMIISGEAKRPTMSITMMLRVAIKGNRPDMKRGSGEKAINSVMVNM